MELPSKKIGVWIIETARMKHAARKNSMGATAQSYLRKKAADLGIEKYQELLQKVSDNPDLYETLTPSEMEFHDISAGVGVWALSAGCINPYIPLQEWLTLEDRIVEDLTTGVQEINPHWFELPADVEEKKTDEPQPISSENSET